MEPSNVSNTGTYSPDKALNLIDDLINKIDQGHSLPVVTAMMHVFNHAANGGTIENFRPILRTENYAGIDRRQTTR